MHYLCIHPGGAEAVQDSRFGTELSGPIFLDQLHCSGNEGKLLDCYHITQGMHMCNHQEDVGIICHREGLCLSISLYNHFIICPSVCLSVCLSVYLSVYLSVCLSIYLSVCLFVCLSVSVCLSSCLPACLPMSLCLSVYLSVSYLV